MYKSEYLEKVPAWRILDQVVFPFSVKSFRLNNSFFESENLIPRETDNYIALIYDNDKRNKNPVGSLCKIVNFNPDGKVGYIATLQGVSRVLCRIECKFSRLVAKVEPLEESVVEKEKSSAKAKIRSTIGKLEFLANSSPEIKNSLPFLKKIEDPSRLSDIVASLLNLTKVEQVGLIEELSPLKRLDTILGIISKEIQIENLKDEIDEKISEDIEKRQREFYLKQQIETLQSALYPEKDNYGTEGYYKNLISNISLPSNVRDVLEKEIKILANHTTYSEEAAQIKAYLDIVFDLPWQKETKDNQSIEVVKNILEKDHYGLKKAKRRILEHIAVKKIGGDERGKIFCFVGPPGVGKTSFAKAIAEAMGRKFVQMSLGGIKDEAEIRGHRKTYIGAMPGRIINGLRQSKSMNPVFLLDEVDKIGYDFKGDPTSALLEALDPKQNDHFLDNYLGFPFDLSKVLFITTANSFDGIPFPLLDRLEVIEFPSFSEDEKLVIAKKYLIPKIEKATNITDVSFDEKAVIKIIRDYTREAGLRNLEREIEKILRSIALMKAEGKKYEKTITEKSIEKILESPPFIDNLVLSEKKVGIATGLAYTETGGELLYCEAVLIDGSGNLILTGQIGEVMKESAQAALTYIKSILKEFNYDPKKLIKKDVHIHFPEGGIPKDGPSAGITIAVALVSAITKMKVRMDIAFTGEINLSGNLLPVGGIREKLLAAQRAKLKEVIVPEKNKRKALEIKKKSLKEIKIVSAKDAMEVLKYVFKDEMPSTCKNRRDS